MESPQDLGGPGAQGGIALKLLNADGFWHMSTSEAAKVEIAGGPDRAKKHAERPQLQLVRKVEVDRSRDDLLTDFGKTTLEDRYLLPGESYQDMFARVATRSNHACAPGSCAKTSTSFCLPIGTASEKAQ